MYEFLRGVNYTTNHNQAVLFFKNICHHNLYFTVHYDYCKFC